MKLYLGDKTTTVTTCLLLGLLAFIVWSAWRRNSIQFWGRRMLILLAFGLLVCCWAATRDGLHLTVQNAIDGSCAPGIFALTSFPVAAGAIGAAVIVFSGLSAVFFRSQRVREVLFFVMSGGVI